MIWLAWRQFRAQAIVASAALVAVAMALLGTGPHLVSLFDSSGLATCQSGCGTDAGNFINQVKGSTTELIFYGGVFLVYAVPALIGLFWGAPLVAREFEAGTFRLAWSQSVTRARWIAVKLGLICLAGMATAGLLSLMTAWWASPLYQAAQKAGQNSLSINRLAPPLFGATGVAPIGYAAFGFVLGVTIGVLIRRTLPAMAVTLAIFAVIQIFWPTVVRPHLIPPVRSVQALSTANFDGITTLSGGQFVLSVTSVSGLPGGWFISSQPITAAGHAITTSPACVSKNNFIACLADHGVKLAVRYQPASRYWAFQWLDTGIFLVLGAGLGALCYWRVRRLS
ncbi:MAG TPA: ABC transporter permease subunit [Streptosporangiaceae bacterium]|nr:ABC transporter permease subunit [Streptosporangiaceae bacterium]